MIGFGPQLCGTLAESAEREWLLADGLGGFAMGTVSGLRSRRYHGLLAPPAEGPSGRMMGLLALDAVLSVGDQRIRLATDEWADGAVDPRGYELMTSFGLHDGVPTWRWQFGDVVVERAIAMAHGRSVVGIVHRLVRSDTPVRLELTPLCTWRSIHGEGRAGGEPTVEHGDDGFVFEGAYRLRGPGWRPAGEWYRGVRWREEAARGLNDHEDVWAAGKLGGELEAGDALGIAAAGAQFMGELPDADDLVAAAHARAAALIATAGADDASARQLVLAADQFIIAAAGGPTAIAGYPWFGEWSRDLMTSYEGLFLCTGRHEEGAAALRRAAATLSEGMLANTADTGTLEYNTADGTLWFVHAVARHVAVTGDAALGAELAPALEELLRRHIAGTRFGIGMDPADGLLQQGAQGWALTWMDARIDGAPVTPRAGKAVEINALWIAALTATATLVELTGRDAGEWRGAAERARASFATRFTRADGGGLLDIVDGPNGDDRSLRPNQLLAVSLADGPFAEGAPHRLAQATARAVVDVCRRELLTPLGLRSLAPSDTAYQPYHRGSPAARDRAYHQGTVWPWLIGPYAEAALRTGVPVDGLLDALIAHLADWGLGSVSETADGAAPHRATGAPFQAWSVAEALRAQALLGGRIAL